MNVQASQESCARARSGHKHIVLFGGKWTKVGPAQSQVEREGFAVFVVILGIEAPEVFAVVLALRCRGSGTRIEAPAFLTRSIVEEVPYVKKIVVRDASTGIVLQVIEPGKFTAKLKRMGSENLGGDVLVTISPLIQDATDVRSKRIYRNSADFTDGVGG